MACFVINVTTHHYNTCFKVKLVTIKTDLHIQTEHQSDLLSPKLVKIGLFEYACVGATERVHFS